MSTLAVDRPEPVTSKVQVAPVTQASVFTSEWIKLRSLRSTLLTLIAAVTTMVAIGWLAGWAANSHWSRLDPIERALFSPIDNSLTGFHVAQLAVGVLGVLLISGEYATGMIRATFSAVPNRLPVLWAKAVLFAGVTFVLMLAAAFAAFLGGQQFLGSHGTTLSAPGAVQSLVGVAGYLTLIAVFAVALGFIIRSTAGGIATLFGILLVLPAIGQILPTSWQNVTLPYLPSNAGASMFSIHTDPSNLSAGSGLIVLCLWVAAALAAAAVLVKQRDA